MRSVVNSGISVDEKDAKIIAELEKDGRQTDAAIARTLGTSDALVRRRIARLIQDDVMRVIAVINPRKVGFNTTAFIGIQAEPSKLDSLLPVLSGMPRVHFLTMTTGPFDVLMWVTFHSPLELADFIKKDLGTIPGIIRNETMLILETAKRTQSILPVNGDSTGNGQGVDKAAEEVSLEGPDSPVEGKLVDDCDCNIMMHLQEDGRKSDAAIARALGLSEATVRRRIRRLLDAGVFSVSPVVAFPHKVGFPTSAIIGIQIDLRLMSYAIKALAALPRVHYVGLATGRYDVIIWATFRSPQDLADFVRLSLSAVPGINRTEASINLEIVKRDLRVLPPRGALRKRRRRSGKARSD